MENSRAFITEVKVKDTNLLKDQLNEIRNSTSLKVLDYPVIYILYRKDREVYIGETTQIRIRLKSHATNKKKYEDALLIYHEMFNQSVTYNLETNLINFFLGDQKYLIDNISQTSQKYTHNYFQKEYFDKYVFYDIWNQLLKREFVNKSIIEIENSDIFKVSPYKSLTEEQIDIQESIVDFCRENINKEGHHVLIIRGDAGTGKSVLLSSTFKRIMDLSKGNSNSLSEHTKNNVLVNHNEMLKTYKNIADKIVGINKNQFEKPTTFINNSIKNDLFHDVTFIDEAHLLLTKADAFNNFTEDNHLEEIIKLSKITIMFFDTMQVLKYKQYWDDTVLRNIIKNHNTKTYRLTNQMRINSNEETQEWMNNFISKKISDIPYDNDYEIRIFDSALEMYNLIKERNNKFGLSRMVSTFDYLHKKDNRQIYYVEEDDFKLPWNSTNSKSSWAEEESSINEVGSIYTIQGFDLNYVGVILGPSVKYDHLKDELYIDSDKYKDVEAFRGLGDLKDLNKVRNIKEEIILNSINVLIKRGTKGLYLYASDEKLRNRLMLLNNKEN